MGIGESRTALRQGLGIFSVALAAASWFFLGPQSVGGPVLYTVITGQSMEPGLQANDLVLLREQASYQVGDAVAYRSRNLRGVVVLHRIVAREGARFVMKGDNNDFLDGDEPSAEEILGKLWFRIPSVGAGFTYLRSPVGMSLAGVGILGILGVFSTVPRRRRRSGRQRRAQPGGSESPPKPRSVVERHAAAPRGKPRPLQITAAVLLVLLLAFGALAWLTFRWPLLRDAPRKIEYAHTGAFDYSARSPKGPVYQQAVVAVGEPIFIRLIRRLQIEFNYAFEVEAEHEIDISGRLLAVLESDNGWSRTIELTSRETSDSDLLELTGQVDLTKLRTMIRTVEDLTGMAPGSYAVSVRPEIHVDGTIGGKQISETFTSMLPFVLDEIQLRLVRSEEDGVTQDLDEMLQPRREEKLQVTGLAPNPLIVAGREVPLVAAQRVAGGGVIVMFLALASVLVLLFRRRARDEPARIEARYGSMLIPVAETPVERQEIVNITEIEKLVRLAQKFDQPIMHQQREAGVHWYVVYYDGLVYRYATAAREQKREGPE